MCSGKQFLFLACQFAVLLVGAEACRASGNLAVELLVALCGLGDDFGELFGGDVGLDSHQFGQFVLCLLGRLLFAAQGGVPLQETVLQGVPL